MKAWADKRVFYKEVKVKSSEEVQNKVFNEKTNSYVDRDLY